ncbi:MAG: hypothetical protein FWE38_03655 [Firmicutes bacterium]|nr:hypothetical protein [Bacillota bacterium]
MHKNILCPITAGILRHTYTGMPLDGNKPDIIIPLAQKLLYETPEVLSQKPYSAADAQLANVMKKVNPQMSQKLSALASVEWALVRGMLNTYAADQYSWKFGELTRGEWDEINPDDENWAKRGAFNHAITQKREMAVWFDNILPNGHFETKATGRDYYEYITKLFGMYDTVDTVMVNPYNTNALGTVTNAAKNFHTANFTDHDIMSAIRAHDKLERY